MSPHCKLILKKFKFLKKEGFKCVIDNPNGFIIVDYIFKDYHLNMITDYRDETEYFSVYPPDVKERKVTRIYDVNIGTQEDREVLKALENTEDNFSNVLNAYTEFIKKNLEQIKQLAH